MSNGTPPVPPLGAPGTGYIIFVRPGAPGIGTVGVNYWNGTDYPTFISQLDAAENANLVIVALDAYAPGEIPAPPPVASCGYAYYYFNADPADAALKTMSAQELGPFIASLPTNQWTVVASGFYFCSDAVPPLGSQPPQPPPPPPPPPGQPPPMPVPADPNADETQYILDTLLLMLVALEAIQTVVSLESPDYTKALALINAELLLIEKTLVTCCKSQSGGGTGNTDPVTCAQLTTLFGNLAALLAGGTTPVNPTPPIPPTVPAPVNYTVAQALADMETAIEQLPYVDTQAAP